MLDRQIKIYCTLHRSSDTQAHEITISLRGAGASNSVDLPKVDGGLQPGKCYTYGLNLSPEGMTLDGTVLVSDREPALMHRPEDDVVVQDICYKARNNTFYISSVEGMNTFRDITNGTNTQVVEGYTEHEGVPNAITHSNVWLLSNLDFDGHDIWMPIDGWRGKFDGNGHTISNIIIGSSGDESGFFSTICPDHFQTDLYYIKDLRFVNCRFESTSVGVQGVLAGRLFYTLIQNCTVECDLLSDTVHIQSTNYAGILAGLAGFGMMIHCSGIANVQSANAGGLAGLGTAITFLGCYVVSNHIKGKTVSRYACAGAERIAVGSASVCAQLSGTLSGAKTHLTDCCNFVAEDEVTQVHVDQMNAAVDAWLATSTEYTITKTLSIDEGVLHFVDKNEST